MSVRDYVKVTREMLTLMRKAGIEPWQRKPARWVMGEGLLLDIVEETGLIAGTSTYALTLPAGSSIPFLWGIPITTRDEMEGGAVELRVTALDRVDTTPYEGVESVTVHEFIVRGRVS